MFTITGKPVMIGKDQQWTDQPENDQERLRKAESRIGEKCVWKFSRECEYLPI